MSRIAVIGSGLGGMSAAAILAAQGHEVHVYESSDTYGGKAGEIHHAEYRFDAGPTLLTLPEVFDKIFSDCGSDFRAQVPLLPLDINCRYFYPDGSVISSWQDPERFAGEIAEKTSDSASALSSFLRYCKRIYRNAADTFMFTRFTEWKNMIKLLNPIAMLRIFAIDPFRTMHTSHRSFFSDKRLIQLFDRYATYNGSDPYRTPATFNIIAHVEASMGSWVPEGGIRSIASALYGLCRDQGVVFHFSAPVYSIAKQGRRITGIRTGEAEIPYDAVVSNVDVRRTYHELLNDRSSRYAKRYAAAEPSSSVTVFYLAIKRSFPALVTHNIIFPEDYAPEFEGIFSTGAICKAPVLYIYVSSKYSPGDAPSGCENWFVLINSPPDNNQDWEAVKNNLRPYIIRRIQQTFGVDITDEMDIAEYRSPRDLARITGSWHGSLYGPATAC